MWYSPSIFLKIHHKRLYLRWLLKYLRSEFRNNADTFVLCDSSPALGFQYFLNCHRFFRCKIHEEWTPTLALSSSPASCQNCLSCSNWCPLSLTWPLCPAPLWAPGNLPWWQWCCHHRGWPPVRFHFWPPDLCQMRHAAVTMQVSICKLFMFDRSVCQ